MTTQTQTTDTTEGQTMTRYYYWVAASAEDNTSVDSGYRDAASAQDAANDESSARRSNTECAGEVVYARSDDHSETASATV